MRNHYKILGVPESASDVAIKIAYRKMAALYHPDHNPHDPLALDEMKMINEAYDVLSDPAKRAHYDSTNTFHAPSPQHHSNTVNEPSPEFQPNNASTPSPMPEYNPFNMHADQAPRHPEDVANVLWTMQDPARNRITPFMKWVLWADLVISISYLIYYFSMRSALPVMLSGFYVGGRRSNWMFRFASAAYLEFFVAAGALYWVKKTQTSLFLKPYLIIQFCLSIYVATAFFGLSTLETNMLIPTFVMLWKGFLIFSLFIIRLDQELWRLK